jgi:hypothetical protein
MYTIKGIDASRATSKALEAFMYSINEGALFSSFSTSSLILDNSNAAHLFL